MEQSILKLRSDFFEYSLKSFPVISDEQRELAWVTFCYKKGIGLPDASKGQIGKDEYLTKRNWKIYFEWIDGKEYPELAKEFGLSHGTIKDICHAHLPPTVRGVYWQSQNAYKKFREWKRAHKNVVGGTVESDIKTGSNPGES